MGETFELYLESEDGSVSFEPHICQTVLEAVQKARTLLAERQLKTVSVHRQGEHLVTLG
jgi:hypothetical protein